jgi:hypothetical protein
MNKTSKKMSFKEFAEKHPDKVKQWESLMNKKWNGEKFI